MTRSGIIAVLAAALLAGACTSSGPPPSSHATRSADPCSLLPEGRVGATLRGAVTQVRELTAEDFVIPPPRGGVACAYETNTHFGQLSVSVQPMTRSEFEARIAERDPANTRQVAHLGDDAVFHGCGGLSIYSKGRVLQLVLQFADCSAQHELVSLARVALQRL